MLSKKENMLAILGGEQPDYYDDFITSMAINREDPIIYHTDFVKGDGQPHKDSWGVTFIMPVGAPGQHPIATPDTLVIKDIDHWQDELVVPDVNDYDWSGAEKAAAAVDRNEFFVAAFSPGGLFERSHHLMGFENALINYLTEEEAVAGLLRVIAEQKKEHIRKVAEVFQPEILFYQDDWGSKTNVFLPPDLWRRLIKPLHAEIVEEAHKHGMLFMHHADCYCQPLVEDMVDMKIDLWQGVIPQNDILEIQRITSGRLPMIGGIDGPIIDTEDAPEELIRGEVRRAIDTYCPAGKFFPGLPHVRANFPRSQEILRDELEKYGRQWAQDHPVAQ